MNPTTRLTVAAIALLAGISAAAAADNAMSNTKTPDASQAASSASQAMAKDKLALTGKQRRAAWRDISRQGTKEKAPKGFTVKVGAALPDTIVTHPVPVSTSNDVPALRPYQYALLSNKLLIVNPSDKKVTQIISR